MKINRGSTTEFELAPSGMHPARCYMMCDLGIQESQFNGETKHLHKIRLSFELTNTHMKDGQPFSVSNNFTASFHPKSNLRQQLECWRGRAFTDEELDNFEVESVVGLPCLLNVVHSVVGDKTYANISAINPVVEGMEVGAAINMAVIFTLDDYSQDQVNALPDWLVKKINFDVPNYEVLNAKQDQNEQSFQTGVAEVIREEFNESNPPPADEFGDQIIPF